MWARLIKIWNAHIHWFIKASTPVVCEHSALDSFFKKHRDGLFGAPLTSLLNESYFRGTFYSWKTKKSSPSIRCLYLTHISQLPFTSQTTIDKEKWLTLREIPEQIFSQAKSAVWLFVPFHKKKTISKISSLAVAFLRRDFTFWSLVKTSNEQFHLHPSIWKTGSIALTERSNASELIFWW